MRNMLVAILALVAAPQAVEAKIIQINFSGQFTGEFESPLVAPGSNFSGNLQYDSDAAPTTTEPGVGRYSFAGPLNLKIGSESYALAFQAFASVSPYGNQWIGFSANIFDDALFTLNFGPMFDVLTAAQLPDDPAAFPNWANAGVSNVRAEGNFGMATVSAFEVSVSAVPEPMTWALMVGGFGIIGIAARRRNQLAL